MCANLLVSALTAHAALLSVVPQGVAAVALFADIDGPRGGVIRVKPR